MRQGIQLIPQMRLEQKLQPRQILAYELLQLPLFELKAELQKEMESNIFLEADDGQVAPEFSNPPEPAPKVTPPGGDEDPTPQAGDDSLHEPGRLKELLDYLGGSKSSLPRTGGDYAEGFDPTARVTPPVDWRQSLAEQIRLERMPDDVADVIDYMAGSLNDRGYLEESLEQIATSTGYDLDVVEDALETLQRIAPTGIGARNLQERLLIQARALPERNETLERILENHFDDVVNARFTVIQKKMGLDLDTLKEALSLLKHIFLEPIEIEDGETPAEIIPDATIEKVDGVWRVRLHDDAVPRLQMSSYARELAANDASLDESTREYVTRSLNRARWMMEALEQRRSTLSKILEAVLQEQMAFFEHGKDHMVPLRQDDIAQQINVHASTVSRAVQDKYVETPHGVLPLKAFFPRGVGGSRDGEVQARNAVQERLQALIAAEDPRKPLSDDKLVRRLREEGIELSRRTVCKYRDELKIPSASMRKNRARVFGTTR